MVGRLIRWIIGGFILTTIGSMVAAGVAKGRVASEGTPESDEIALAAILDSVTLESRARSFRGGSLLAWFGGIDLDLRQATLDPAGAHLTVRAIFGGGRLLVPAEWNVEVRMMAIFGGVGDARPPMRRPADAPRLVVDGFVLFGGFGIDSRKVEDVRGGRTEVGQGTEEAMTVASGSAR